MARPVSWADILHGTFLGSGSLPLSPGGSRFSAKTPLGHWYARLYSQALFTLSSLTSYPMSPRMESIQEVVTYLGLTGV